MLREKHRGGAVNLPYNIHRANDTSDRITVTYYNNEIVIRCIDFNGNDFRPAPCARGGVQTGSEVGTDKAKPP